MKAIFSHFFIATKHGSAILALLASTLTVAMSTYPGQADSPAFRELLQNGDTKMNQEQYGAAEQSYLQAIKLEPDSTDAHNQLGLCYARQAKLLEAAGEFKSALKIQPKFLPSLNNLGSVYYRNGNYDEAIRYYQQALELKDGSDTELNTNLASVYRDRATFEKTANREADFNAAIEHYQRALKDDPKFSQAHNNLGLCLLRLRRFEEAATAIRRAITLKPDYAAAYYNLGLIEQARNNLPEALTAFQTSLRYETIPQYAEMTRQRVKDLGMPLTSSDPFSHGFDLLSQHKWSESEAEFRKVIATTNGVKRAIALNNLGYVLSKQGRSREAIEAYKKAASRLPGKFPAALYNMGQVMRTSGDLNGAEEAFKQALSEAHGTHALAHNALGMVLKQKGDFAGAQSQYRLAIMQSGDTLPVVHYNLGLLFEKQGGKASQAAEEFRHYLAQAPDGYSAQIARTKAAQLGP